MNVSSSLSFFNIQEVAHEQVLLIIYSKQGWIIRASAQAKSKKDRYLTQKVPFDSLSIKSNTHTAYHGAIYAHLA